MGTPVTSEAFWRETCLPAFTVVKLNVNENGLLMKLVSGFSGLVWSASWKGYLVNKTKRSMLLNLASLKYDLGDLKP
jgi:hypothetical protein